MFRHSFVFIILVFPYIGTYHHQPSTLSTSFSLIFLPIFFFFLIFFILVYLVLSSLTECSYFINFFVFHSRSFAQKSVSLFFVNSCRSLRFKSSDNSTSFKTFLIEIFFRKIISPHFTFFYPKPFLMNHLTKKNKWVEYCGWKNTLSF